LQTQDDLPIDLRAVVGVLTYKGAPFCTGTIVGDYKILTSKHCFVNQDGSKARAFSAYFTNQINFETLVTHNGLNTFRVRPPKVDEARAMLSPYETGNDTLELSTAEKFTKKANVLPFMPDNFSFPIGAYLIGSNINLDDLAELKLARDYVRGVSPEKSCAILESTENGCLYQSCQSSKSTSGAGLLIKNSVTGDVQLIGVHRGPMDVALGCEATPPTTAKLNVAVFL